MAFFAVMLPDAFKDPDTIKAGLIKSFKEMTKDEIQSQQKNVVKLGQMIRDSIVAESIAKGIKPPSTSTSSPPSSTSTPAPTVTAPSGTLAVALKYSTAQSVRDAWKKIANTHKASKPTPTPAVTRDSIKDGWKIIDTFLKGKSDDDIKKISESDIDTEIGKAKSLLKGGSRIRTPRRTGRRHSYKQKVRH